VKEFGLRGALLGRSRLDEEATDMAGGQLQKTLGYLRRLADTGEVGALSDAELLRRFVRSRDEAAFEVLLWRHGPLVLGVCRRVLRQEQDAEDAFQAAFLALARKAHTLSARAALAAWLYKVAFRIALKARKRSARHAARPLTEPPAVAPGEELLWRDLRPVLDEELDRLPEKYRAPVLLCDLQGLTHEEAALRVGCPPGTLSVRLMRARERLRARLIQRGLAPCAVLLGTALAERAFAAVGSPLVSQTVKAALAFAAGSAAVPPAAAALAQGALREMLLTRVRNLTLALAAGLLAILAGALCYNSLQAAPPAPPQTGEARQPQARAAPQTEKKPGERPKATPKDVAATVAGNTRFALDLYGRLRTQEGNLFLSPYSLSTALAMAYAGARGETAEQMAKTLHFTLGQDKLHPAFAQLAGQLKGGKKSGYRLNVANALWGQKDHRFLAEFLELSREFYGGGLKEVDFLNATEQARQAINTWAEEQTEKKVKELLRPGVLDEQTRLVLTNAVYFNAAWERPFDKKLTRPEPFFLTADPDRKVNVPMMYQDNRFGYWANEEVQVLELPYKGKDLSMVLLLPVKVDGLPQLENRLTPANLKKWLGGLETQRVWVTLPRFTCTSAFSLKKALADMGMPRAFEPGGADFSGLDESKRLFIQAVEHKAFVKVDEIGTEAAAATAVVVNVKSEPPSFRADHPFLFLIRDNRTGAVLFLGRFSSP
jgi:RNA polymerase sigma factor (sigma-70 family)